MIKYYVQKQPTGAMYSSVPTKEFDALIGSAINIGGCWLFCAFFFSFMDGTRSCKEHNQHHINLYEF